MLPGGDASWRTIPPSEPVPTPFHLTPFEAPKIPKTPVEREWQKPEVAIVASVVGETAVM